MPRQKKPPGTAVDKRNGQRAELAVVAGGKLDPPEGLCEEALAQWDAYWDDAASTVQTSADRGVILRWADSVNRYLRTIGEADLEPLVTGSTGQLVANPLYGIAEKALRTIEACEKQLGIGALHRAGLGIAVLTERRSLQDMNAQYGGADGGNGSPAFEANPEADPRVIEA